MQQQKATNIGRCHWKLGTDSRERVEDQKYRQESVCIKMYNQGWDRRCGRYYEKELIAIDCEKQEELEDNYNNKLHQKFAEQTLYCKSGIALYIVFYGQLHSEVVTIAKRLITPLFEIVHKERDVVLLSILWSICIKNLFRSKVNLYLEQLKIFSTTLFHVQIKGISNHDFGDAIHNQVFTTQSRCGVFAFGDNYHAKVLSDDGYTSLKDYFSFDQAKKDKYD